MRRRFIYLFLFSPIYMYVLLFCVFPFSSFYILLGRLFEFLFGCNDVYDDVPTSANKYLKFSLACVKPVILYW